jgi:predicted ferric reductase
LLYRRTGPRRGGTLQQNRRKGEINELVITLDRPFHAEPGQFVWISVEQSAAPIPRELHPFSISQIVDANTLRISAKTLGDYTARLRDLAPEDRIGVYGPYGAFGKKYLATPHAMVWIAGGIGITPFLSMLHAEAAGPRDREIILVWVVSHAEDAVYHAEIEQLCRSASQIRYYLYASDARGRLTVATLEQLVGRPFLDRARIFMCGPLGMMHALTRQFVAQGKARQEIISEEFAMR